MIYTRYILYLGLWGVCKCFVIFADIGDIPWTNISVNVNLEWWKIYIGEGDADLEYYCLQDQDQVITATPF